MRWHKQAWVALTFGLVGCVPGVNPRAPVRVEPTRTPGVAMVVVRPEFERSRNTGEIDRGSEYVLLCDGRPAEGMRCHILPEVGADRRSWAVTPEALGPNIDLGVATLADVDISHSKENPEDTDGEQLSDDVQPTPTATPSAAPSAPPPTGTVTP